mmetsp:Transcript_194/g.593  ORF Transcript_194/g.593 Transcript_194/m.593 type:complete len:306 (-) Transcript_194:92-1009(-)
MGTLWRPAAGGDLWAPAEHGQGFDGKKELLNPTCLPGCLVLLFLAGLCSGPLGRFFIHGHLCDRDGLWLPCRRERWNDQCYMVQTDCWPCGQGYVAPLEHWFVSSLNVCAAGQTPLGAAAPAGPWHGAGQRAEVCDLTDLRHRMCRMASVLNYVVLPNTENVVIIERGSDQCYLAQCDCWPFGQGHGTLLEHWLALTLCLSHAGVRSPPSWPSSSTASSLQRLFVWWALLGGRLPRRAVRGPLGWPRCDVGRREVMQSSVNSDTRWGQGCAVAIMDVPVFRSSPWALGLGQAASILHGNAWPDKG